ncbi:hypothetical protein M413DRAFT_32329 [Hebeloma cylindrosporum]|uniref:Uncharacterized protein n=1 Tax=Hebeloma cylindrosporum TaxID=76867 RepID=A0A0C2Y3M8_HEBCY|nr:hypothetical protein M413DRAFT_32329 [Hebeloma cylindrosporum h7]
MPKDRCEECGVLSALRSKPDVLKLAESCSIGDGHSRCDPCGKFATLQAQVQEAEKALLKLKAAQRSLISDINFHHSFMRNIPNEVIGVIFSFCHDPCQWRTKGSKSRKFSMLTLGAICRRWREIAWATPELWTFLLMPNIPQGSSPSNSFSRQLELAEEWLGRSANLPLRIALETKVEQRNLTFNPYVGKLIDILNSCSGRWRCLELCIPKIYLSRFHYRPSETAHNDERGRLYHLRLEGFRLFSKGQVSFNADGDLLKPTEVTLGALTIRHLRIDWGNVTSLRCGSLFVDESFELIRLAPNLMDFTVLFFSGSDEHPIPAAPLVHSQLRQLSISHKCFSNMTMDLLFSKLTLPSLESFCYEVFRAQDQRSNDLIELLDRSHPPLRHLSLVRIVMDNENFIDLMTHVPQLEELEILFNFVERMPSFDCLLSKLGATHISNPSDLPFLPRLRSLKCQFHKIQPPSLELIPIAFGMLSLGYDMGNEEILGNDEIELERRQRPLQSFIISFECPPSIEYPTLGKPTADYLLNLIENEGKRIEISYSGLDLLRQYESADVEGADKV